MLRTKKIRIAQSHHHNFGASNFQADESVVRSYCCITQQQKILAYKKGAFTSQGEGDCTTQLFVTLLLVQQELTSGGKFHLKRDV